MTWLLILIAAGLVGGVAWLLLSGDKEPEIAYTNVPNNLINLSQADAKSEIEAAELVFKLGDPVESDDIEQGKVAETDPPGGEEVEVGSVVEVRLSAGPSTEELADMTGFTREQVDKELKRLGFVTGTVSEENDPKQKGGLLLRTSPPAGAVLPRGASIDLIFSSGNVEVPGSLVGQPQEEAASRLRELTFNPEVRLQESASVAAGYVISMNPMGVLPQGSVIQVYVSTGPPPPPPPPSPPQSG